jgi:hypothetical protein
MNGNNSGPQPRSGRDLFMVPVADRLNDQFRFIDTMILSMTDSWAYLPPRAKHILWLKLASAENSFLEQVGMPLENGILIHWSMWPDDLGDYAQAVAMRMSRQQLEYLEPKNVAMASAVRQAEIAESTARLQIQLAQALIQLSQMGAQTEDLANLFSKNRFDKESMQTVLSAAEEEMQRRTQARHQQQQQQQQESALRATPSDVPSGLCQYCGMVKPYVLGEDDEGTYYIESCVDCLPTSGLLQEEDMLSNFDPTMSPEELERFAQIANDEDNDGWITLQDETSELTLHPDEEGVWVDTTDGPVFVENTGEEE